MVTDGTEVSVLGACGTTAASALLGACGACGEFWACTVMVPALRANTKTRFVIFIVADCVPQK